MNTVYISSVSFMSIGSSSKGATNYNPWKFLVSNNMIIAFDLEGTLVDGELLPAIGDELGIRQKLEALTAQAMDGEVDYVSSLIKRIELIRGISIHRVIEISRGSPSSWERLKPWTRSGYWARTPSL